MLFKDCRVKFFAAVAVIWAFSQLGVSRLSAQQLDADLKALAPTRLAALAGARGDATRGAVVFFQQSMACGKCHSVGVPMPNALGPDLTSLGKEVTDVQLVEAVLHPSKSIRKGFESATVQDSDGKTWVGILVERTPEKIVLRDALRDGELVTLAANDVEQFRVNETSIMPESQVNQLQSQQQFLDLIKYLMEIRDGGSARARELQPPAALLALTIPEYENHIDHAGFVRDWNAKSLERGEKIYKRVCQNCHGTREQVGSLPTSLRFAEGKFKNGSDPLAMYQTLTRGFGLMTAQTWMVPSQKYDVIHYIRETYLRPHNPSQYVSLDDTYLAKLPKGDTRGPEPSKIEAWSAMDYGPSLTHTYEIPDKPKNFAYKGIAVRLDDGAGGVSRGRHWMVFDTDTLRMAAGWSANKQDENFINWRGIQLNGEHGIHPTLVGKIAFTNAIGPGWAHPSTGSFADDQRVTGRDGKQYGPLPREWGHFRGQYLHGQHVVLSYTVGQASILESPRWINAKGLTEHGHFVRIFNIGPRDHELVLQVAKAALSPSVTLYPANIAKLGTTGEQITLTVPAGKQDLKFAVCLATDRTWVAPEFAAADLDLAQLTQGGPPRWPQRLTTLMQLGDEKGPFAADTLTAPETNPWMAQTRFTGLDFFPDGRIAVCSWDGDVWIVTPNSATNELTWQRIATGLFQPLGLKVIDEKIYLTCRDQLAVLHDLNGDGEIDFYECLNNDHQVTEHFHEFAMGLQTDEQGNFYYAKSARHALKAVVPQHGTLLRVSRDGLQTDIIANGFRAANGVCLNPDGSFVVTDQEGHWNPKNRINWVTLDPSGKPKFYGNMFGYHDVTDESDSAMVPPLCWITNAFDRSPAELLWVTSDRWGPLKGALLNLSYGYGKVYVVPHENAGGVMQGGLIELPLPPFPTGVMRGRFHPTDGQLYLCGMFAWAGSATHPGGLYRIRATGKPMYLPIGIHASKAGLELKFTEPLDAQSIDLKNIEVKTWSLKRTANYGSKHFDEKTLDVNSAKLSADGKSLLLQIDQLQPTWGMEVYYALRGRDGSPVVGTLHNTINRLAD